MKLQGLFCFCLQSIFSQVAATSATIPTDAESLCDQKILSESLGYLLWDELQHSLPFAYQLEDVIAGIRKAERGDKHLTNPRHQELVKKVEQILYKKKIYNQLIEAEQFLQTVSKQKGVEEIIEGKLYLKKIQEGHGQQICPHGAGIFHLNARTLQGVSLVNTFEENLPKLQELDVAIPGFAIGVQGMKEEEIRILYIHPDLAYGVCHDIEPNSLIIVDVKLLSVRKKTCF